MDKSEEMQMEKPISVKNEITIEEKVKAQREFFMTHTTLDVNYRIAYLKKLKEVIRFRLH